MQAVKTSASIRCTGPPRPAVIPLRPISNTHSDGDAVARMAGSKEFHAEVTGVLALLDLHNGFVASDHSK